MKKGLTLFVLVILLAGIVSACQPQAAAPQATTPPEPAAPASKLDAIKTAGKIKVGTSADYPPYESVDSAGAYVGFDIELMAAIAEGMGVQLEWVDMPFDSLIAAVQENKIDLSISCFNYSEERDQQVDFSEAYYTSEDAFVVGKDFTGTIAKPEDVVAYKVGVQSGTVQDDWLTTNLVDTGLLKAENLSRYERVDQAALDLQAGRVDVLMADYVPANALVKQFEGFNIVLKAVLSTGPLNIVLPEGDAVLKAEVDKQIAALQASGKITELAEKYFSE
jgi:polar amino acid transport system substrate-binding protein